MINFMFESLYFTDDNIDETYGVNVQFEESEDEVLIFFFFLSLSMFCVIGVHRDFQQFAS